MSLVSQLYEELDAAQAERDELRAQVEAMRAAVSGYLQECDDGAHDYEVKSARHNMRQSLACIAGQPMKRKLQVKQGKVWFWVAMVQGNVAEPITTTCKAQAMPEKTYWFTDSLAIMSKRFPDHEFRLAESRDT